MSEEIVEVNTPASKLEELVSKRGVEDILVSRVVFRTPPHFIVKDWLDKCSTEFDALRGGMRDLNNVLRTWYSYAANHPGGDPAEAYGEVSKKPSYARLIQLRRLVNDFILRNGCVPQEAFPAWDAMLERIEKGAGYVDVMVSAGEGGEAYVKEVKRIHRRMRHAVEEIFRHTAVAWEAARSIAEYELEHEAEDYTAEPESREYVARLGGQMYGAVKAMYRDVCSSVSDVEGEEVRRAICPSRLTRSIVNRLMEVLPIRIYGEKEARARRGRVSAMFLETGMIVPGWAEVVDFQWPEIAGYVAAATSEEMDPALRRGFIAASVKAAAMTSLEEATREYKARLEMARDEAARLGMELDEAEELDESIKRMADAARRIFSSSDSRFAEVWLRAEEPDEGFSLTEEEGVGEEEA